MSYRIQVVPDASSLFRTLAPHVVLHLGHALGELADLLSAGGEVETDELRFEDWVLGFVVDRAHSLLRVVRVEQQALFVSAFAH